MLSSSRGFPRQQSNHRAFTLIELLIAIGIISILASIVIVAVNPGRHLAQARNTLRRSAVQQILKATQQYLVKNGSLPAGIDASPRMIGTDAAGCAVSCGTSMLGPPIPFSVRVASSSDDAEEEVATDDLVYLTSTDLEMVQDYDPARGNQLIGIRFQNITVPQGAVIATANIQFVASLDDGTGNEATSLTISGQDSDDASTFTMEPNNISTRPKTSATVVWDAVPAWSVGGVAHDSPDLSHVLQEIVDRSGWASGNDVVFMIEGSGRRPAYSYNENPSWAPLLSLTYSVAGMTLPACLNLTPALGGTYLADIPTDPRYGSGAKTYYAVQKLSANRIHVEACGAELDEEIAVEQ